MHYDNAFEINEDHNQIVNILSVNKLTEAIIRSKEAFFINTSRNEKFIDCEDKRVLDIFRYIRKETAKMIQLSFPIHSFNPYIELFKNVTAQLELERYVDFRNRCSDDELANTLDTLNKFLENIRNEAGRPEFKTSINNFQHSLRRNRKSLMDFIELLSARHSKLMVLRINFHYSKEFNNSFERENEFKDKYFQAAKDLKKFLNSVRKRKLSKHMVGYAWKLEYASLAGFHYHLLFFFDGSEVWDGGNRAKMIGEYWQNIITQGRGRYFNGNDKEYVNNNEDCGIVGMIDFNDPYLKEGLKKTVNYLTMPDYAYYAKIVAPDNGDTFGKGGLAKKTTGINIEKA